MQSPISKGVMNAHPLEQTVGQRSTGVIIAMSRFDRRLDAAIHCNQCPVATVKMISRYCPEFSMTQSAKRRAWGMKNLLFPEDSDPFRHISCLAEGGLTCIMCCTGDVFLPSDNAIPARWGG